MIKYKLYIVIIILLFNSWSLKAKDRPMSPEVDSINNMLNQIAVTKIDSVKLELNYYLISYFAEFLETEEAFNADFDSVKYVNVLQSEDDKLRVYTWNLSFKDGSFKYFGFLQYKTKKDYYVYFLDDKKSAETENERWFRAPAEWYGALYYEIITTKWNSKYYYTLIGWDGADYLINRKVIEVLSFNRKGIASFGKNAFKVNKSTANRLIFEYSDRATMIIRYNEKQGMIILDHLSPPEPKYKGMHQYYGPDFSYDAFIFRGGRWLYKSNIDPEEAINYKRNSHVNFLNRRGASDNF